VASADLLKSKIKYFVKNFMSNLKKRSYYYLL